LPRQWLAHGPGRGHRADLAGRESRRVAAVKRREGLLPYGSSHGFFASPPSWLPRTRGESARRKPSWTMAPIESPRCRRPPPGQHLALLMHPVSEARCRRKPSPQPAVLREIISVTEPGVRQVVSAIALKRALP
jgi:hypothetical protein